MKKSKFTEQQIAYALRQAESGVSVEEITRKMGITQATFYRWKKKFAGNSHRPHSSLGDLTPAKFAESCTASGQPTADLQQYSRATNSVKFA